MEASTGFHEAQEVGSHCLPGARQRAGCGAVTVKPKSHRDPSKLETPSVNLQAVSRARLRERPGGPQAARLWGGATRPWSGHLIPAHPAC